MNRETIIKMAREAGFGEMFSTVFCGELERLYALAVAKEREECGNTESTSEVVMVDGTGAGKRLIDPRESHYITALVELRRQMAEMQAIITRMVEGKV